MKKAFTSFAGSCSRTLSLAVIAVASVATAHAADPVDLGELSFGEIYSFPQFATVSATFTAPATGTLRVDGGNELVWYTDADHTTQLPGTHFSYSPVTEGCKGQIKDYEVTEGSIYYLFSDFTMDAQSFCLYMAGVSEEPLKALWITPEPVSTWDLNRYADWSAEFNKEFTVEADAYILKADGETVLSDVTAAVDALSVKVANVSGVLTKALNDGEINPGEEFYVAIQQPVAGETVYNPEAVEGVSVKNINDKAFVLFSYKCGSIPVKVVSEKVPSKFLSYWTPGNAEAIVSLTFDGELSLKPQIEGRPQSGTYFAIGYGNQEGEYVDDYYYVEVVPTLSDDKKTISVDLAGVRRTPADMLPNSSYSDYSTIKLAMCGVVDQYGNPVDTGNPLKIGTFEWSLPYEVVPAIKLSAEFTPANGTSLDNADNMEVYFSSLKGVTFTGFKFTYVVDETEKTAVVPLADCTFAKEEDGGTYTFAIPADVKAAGNVPVTVTLDGLVTDDGYDHSFELKAQYNTFVLTYSDPANGASLASLPEDFVVKFTTNWTEKYPELVLEYQIRDMNADNPDEAVIKTAFELSKGEDNVWAATLPSALTLYQNHEYHIEVNAWTTAADYQSMAQPVGSSYVVILGATKEYQNSVEELLFINPDPAADTYEPLTSMNNVITLEFSGLVYLDKDQTFINQGQGVTMPFASIEPLAETGTAANDEEIVTCNMWSLTVPETYMASLTAPLTISFKAYDEQGRVLRGNSGKGENSFFSYEFPVASQFAQLEITVEGEAPYEEVAGFIVSSTDGIAYNLDESHGEALVYKGGAREIVAKVVEVVDPEHGDDPDYFGKTDYLRLVLDKPITEKGEYLLAIPQDYFYVGEEFSSRPSAATNFKFNVGDVIVDVDPDVNVVADPKQGDVESLGATISLVFPDYDEVGLGSGKPSLTINDGEPVELEDAELDWDVWNKVNQPLGQTYTEVGKYVISYPAGYFMLGSDAVESPAFTLTYNIVEGGGAEVADVNYVAVPAAGEVPMLETIDLTFTDYEEAGGGQGKANLSIDGNEPILLPDAEFGMEFNEMVQPLGQQYVAEGTYVVSFPAGYFLLGSEGEECPAFTITYLVDGSTVGISSPIYSADGIYRVYNLNGVKVLETESAADLRTLAPGVYIINTTKVVIR